MSTDSAGVTDSVHARLNDAPPPGADFLGVPLEVPSIPGRPADSARKSTWAAYVVALGLHPDDADAADRATLIEHADRLDPRG